MYGGVVNDGGVSTGRKWGVESHESRDNEGQVMGLWISMKVETRKGRKWHCRWS